MAPAVMAVARRADTPARAWRRLPYATETCIGVCLCTVVVVSLGILPYIKRLDTFCQGVQLPLLAFLVSS